MRKLYLLSTLVLLAILCGNSLRAQDFSNKGKNFYICYPEHINGTGSIMGLYLTSDVNTTGVIDDNGTIINFSITANNITTVFLGTGGSGPNTYIHMTGVQDGIKSNAAVHITALKPIVVYAHIINAARSGATLALPTNVWGKEYYIPSYANSGAATGLFGYPEINIMAALPNTVIEITPTITTRNGLHPAGVPYQITLVNPGDVYQVQFPQNQDPSGTLIKSLSAASSGGCPPIAVISATTWTALNCGSGNGGDNFYQQLFPSGAWGKNFITTPMKRVLTNPGDQNTDIIRIYVKTVGTTVNVTNNGVTTTLAGLVTPGNFYEYESPNPTIINADRPVQVMQYVKTQGCPSPGSPTTNSDPEMIALSAVEQTINDITVYSAINTNVPGGNSQVTTHYINATMKTANTGSFTINGNAPTASWIPIPGSVYSFLKQQIFANAPVSRLRADSGFNAIAYGFGNVESYGYNAGTNVKDLYQQLGVQTQLNIETTPSVCKDATFKLKVSLPYCADSILWDLTGLPGPPVPSTIMTRYTTCNPGVGGPDSTTAINGVTLYWYSIPGNYTINTAGTYPITITVYKSTADDCGNEQEISFDLTVYDPPVPDFTFTGGECPAVPVQFNDATTTPRPSYLWSWNFGDPASGANNTSTIQNPVHTFSGPGTYTVSFSTTTTPGCVSNVVTHQVTIPDLPNGTVSAATTACLNGTADVTFTGTGAAPFTFYYHINGGPALSVNSAAGPPASNTATVAVNTSTAGTFTYTLDSIRTVGSTFCVRNITGQSVTVTVAPDHAIAMSSAAGTDNQQVCLNGTLTNITYTLSGGATGATVTGLPAGVTSSVSGTTLTISGAPTTGVGSPFSFTVTTTGNPCNVATASGTITVNPAHTVNLSSAASTTSQSVCINTSLTNITYTLGGGATGATVTGLPAGVTSSVSGNTLTISGTPTTSTGSPFSYTITTTGNPCAIATANGTITVNPAHAIALSSAAGTNNQNACVNIPITNITYTLSGGATGATVTGLPAGVTFAVSGNTVTISGTPTTAVGSPFNFTVTTSGNACTGATQNGSLTITPDHAIALSSAAATANQSTCINTAITNITYTLSGGATGGTVTGLPPGVTSSVTGNALTISGTPTSSAGSPYNFTITTTGNSCVTANASGSITVTPAHAIALSSGTSSQTVCVNTAIVNITYTLSGGATGATVTGLPAGVTYSVTGTTLTITGTPSTSVGSPFNFNISTTGNACTGATANGSITVNSNHSIALSSAASTTNQTTCINTAITNITYTLGGGATGATVTGLPTGVTSSVAGNTLTISGTPTTTTGSPFNYTITTTGNSCVTATSNGSITVTPAHAVALSSGTASQTVCVNTAIVNITYTLSGGATGATVTGLPAGVTSTVTGNTVTISGTPTTATGSPFSFTLNTTGNTCNAATANGTITVNADHAIALSSAAGTNNQSVCINTAITTITYTLSGGATGATVTGLPPGVTSSVSGNTITISGTATSSAGSPYAYSINTTGNGCLVANASGAITVTPAHSVNLSSAAGTNAQTVCVNTALTTITYTLGGGASSATVTGLPAGVTSSVTGNTLTISGTPTSTTGSPFTYTINTSGNSCTPATANGSITVSSDHTISLSSAASTTNQSVCVNTAITGITYSLGGGATGATVTGLPAGVTSSVSGGVLTISGTPTSTTGSPFNFNITTTGNSCVVATGSGTINVVPAHAMTLSSPASTTSQTVCVNNSIVSITYTLSGGATGATVTGLPAGVTSNVSGNTLTISGTPTSSAGSPFNYSVVTTGNSCATASANGTLNVNPDHTISLTSAAATTSQTVCTDRPMTAITYSINGGATGATVTGLPPGVTSTVVGNTVTISGSPTSVAGSPYNYSIITTGNGCNTATANGSITTLQTPAVQLDAVAGRCADQPSFQMTGSPAGGVFSGSGVNGTGLFNPNVSGAGDHVITYTYTAANGCSNTSLQTVSIYPMPIVDAGPDKGIIEGGQITLTPLITANFPVTYMWVPAQYLSNPNIANPIVSGIPDDQTYTLTVTSDKGCSASDQVFVKLLRRIEIPNIFSPNGDGIHDKWEIQYLESYPGCTVDIYNRYGQKVFHSEGYTNPWDGTINGKPVPVGTYYYIINPKNGRSQMAGYVDVIR